MPSYWWIMTPVNTRALTGDIDEECDMQGEGHLLSNHVDIIPTINNTIKHFLYVKSFCDEQKICLNLVRQGQNVFAILPTGSGESLIFQLFSLIMNVIKGKVGMSISTIIIIAPLVTIMKYQAQAIWKNTSNSHRLGAGGRHGQRHGNVGKVWDH